MSGRVRWLNERGRCELRGGDAMLRAYRDEHGRWIGDDDRAVQPHAPATSAPGRRSDAKRWLLARAAGLAEVPRRRSPVDDPGALGWASGALYVRSETPPNPPSGWRVTWSADVTGTCIKVKAYERNRRRR